MDKPEEKNETSRRNFLKGIAAMPVLALTGGKDFAANESDQFPQESMLEVPPAIAADPGKKFVAIQIGARSFVDEGVSKCLDTLQQKVG